MELAIALHILMIGVIVVLSILLRTSLERKGLPVLVSYFVVGFLIRMADAKWQILSEDGYRIFEFLAMMGVIALLFRIGLESKMARLIKLLPAASLIWTGNVLFSGGLGFAGAYYLLSLSFIPSLFVAVALTATSVGIATAIWQEAGMLESATGELMLDVAELDDSSGVVLMALLFSIAPMLRGGQETIVLPAVGWTLGSFILKFALFAAFCVAFARYLERPLTAFFERITDWEESMLVVVGIGLIVAASAELLGFSVAIGAFFAGLIFSRDPDSVRFDASFGSLHDLFAPFFFVGIGLKVDPGVLSAAPGPTAVLLSAAVLGKLIGDTATSRFVLGTPGAVLLGISMVPRAEIMLIVMQRGLQLGDWAVPPDIFANMVLVSAITALVVPVVLRTLLKKWPQTATAL